MRRIVFLCVTAIIMTGLVNTEVLAKSDKPFWTKGLTAEKFTQIQEKRLKDAKKILKKMTSVKGKQTVENTLVPYDEIQVLLDAAGNQAGLMENVHPDEKFRAASEKISQEISAFLNELSLNRDVYDALVAIDLKNADAATKYYVEKTLRDFRLSGVDKDEATRKKIKALNDEIVLIGQEFGRNIRNGKRTVTVDDVSELDGLPQDYIDAHKPNADGKIILTTEYPDALPVFSYAKSEKLRKEMYLAYNNRAFPENIDVLDRLAKKRHELAVLLGFKSYADYITADKMIKSAANADDFITKIVNASEDRAMREYQELLKRKQKDVAGAKAVNRWEQSYYTEIVSKENYDFDSQSVRPYFQYDKVKNGVLDVTSRVFGVEFKQIKDAPVWYPSVEAWEMFEDGKLVARFYLDMHPREGKYSHAAHFGIRTGVAGKQIPEASLVCNFPEPTKDNPGLMEYNDVNTFFHEFGHLIHSMFAGRQKWIGLGGISTERDFVEAPSQLLEEWTRDPKTLQTFAKHYKTGDAISTKLVMQMNRADEFGKGLQVRRQMEYARLSLSIYDRNPKDINTDGLVKSITDQYSPFPFVADTHFQTAFGHLDGYSAIYYTYMWSLVLAKDMFSEFDKSNLLDAKGVAKRYRQTILAPGGSKPANQLVEDFLGRESNFKAYQDWLNEDTPESK
ncbi:MAG: Zn-dependent oligopeptidase [Acidobacteriota bacterium]|jgi:thimet oligopeptidase|nr:Zn-dependent oligopeptidase [Acidobacteriota bacterium]